MNAAHEVSFAWLNWYVFLVSIVQILIVGYRWRERARRLPFSILGGAVVVAVWGAAFFFPFEYHTTVEMPSGGQPATNAYPIVSVISTVVVTFLVVGLNQLLLLGVRAGLNWRRGR
jgi:hypothetical protein